MKKQNIYLFVGLAWLSCCIYQLKNSNRFMAVASTIVSFLCFALAIHKAYVNKDAESNDNNDKSGESSYR